MTGRGQGSLTLSPLEEGGNGRIFSLMYHYIIDEGVLQDFLLGRVMKSDDFDVKMVIIEVFCEK